MRNLACHRAGLREDVRQYLFNPHQPEPQAHFWIQAHNNFLDACVLDWWKMFADDTGKHHWRCVIDDREGFGRDLYATGIGRAEYKKTIKEVDQYRHKFVAHLDDERKMCFPELDVAKKATVFLYDRLAQLIASREEWRDLPTSAEALESLFEHASKQAESVYAQAVRHQALRAARQL
jgi:hypothetical protein